MATAPSVRGARAVKRGAGRKKPDKPVKPRERRPSPPPVAPQPLGAGVGEEEHGELSGSSVNDLCEAAAGVADPVVRGEAAEARREKMCLFLQLRQELSARGREKVYYNTVCLLLVCSNLTYRVPCT